MTFSGGRATCPTSCAATSSPCSTPGCYAESLSANFNAQCRPATVLVSGTQADVITERERLDDVMGRFRVPPRLLEAVVRE